MAELFHCTVTELSDLIGKREISPVDIVRSCLNRIASVNEAVNAFVTLQPEIALAEARKAEEEIGQGKRRGPLHGIPIAHKDLYWSRGLRSTAGSQLKESFTPDEDATVVSRYGEAGAILLGKLNTQEFAYGPTNEHSMFGPTRNPWDLRCYSGGSSGGSAAALALEMLPAATGTDTGGSIRIPAACCGVSGLKPTYGRVSRYGVFPLCWTMDHPGPMARSARDLAMLLQPIAGHDSRDPTTSQHIVPDYSIALDSEVGGQKIGVPRQYFFSRAQPDIEMAVNRALDKFIELGAEVRSMDIPDVEHAAVAAAIIYYAEATAYHDDDLSSHPELYTERVRTFLELGNFILARDYLQAQRFRTLIGRHLHAVLEKVDYLITPTLPITASPMGQTSVTIRGVEQPVYLALLRNTEPFNLSGLPALTIPCGFAENGMPIGLQIIGRPFDEAGVLRLGAAFQQITDWHLQKPSPL
jgi:aspartyl-tRNA(Asn)/glutamyl-tRNA(Gln) amidotransferase subunit A